MDPELDNGTETEQPADDIRSSLAAALAESEGAAPEGTQPAAKTDGTEAPSAVETRERGADGKFLKKAADGAETDPAAKAAPAKTEQPDPAAQATGADTKEAPAHWSQADKDKFKAQPPEAQAFILDRFKAMEGDYTRKTQEIANFKKEYGPVDEMFAPHKDVLRQKGFTPRSLIEAWANVETKLAAGPDSAVDVIKSLVSGYNISPAKLAAALGITGAQQQQQPNGTQQQPAATENGQPVALPPEVANELRQLREQVGQFGQKFQTIEQREQAQRDAIARQQENDAENTVNEFRNSKDDKGNLLHPHMAEVEGMMTALANAALASKQPVPSLKELYETAVYAHTPTREKVLTAQRQQEEQKRVDDAKAKAASARKAGSSITGAPGSGGQAPNGKTSGDSIRDSLEAAFEDVA